MQNKHETVCAFCPEPLDDTDKSNLLTAGIARLQMFLGVAYNRREQLHWLAQMGIHAILRIEEPSRDDAQEIYNSYYSPAGRLRIVRQISEILDSVPGLTIEACISGNEPEIEYDLERGSENWGNKPEMNFRQGRLWQHQYAVGELRKLLTPMGIVTVAPGWSHKRLTPRDPAEPGRQSWARACGTVYNEGPAGMHAYCINWQGPEDENRLLWRVGIELERIQGDAWVNEISVRNSRLSDIERMRAIMGMYDLIFSLPWADAIKSFCPFVANGRAGQEWSAMIMRDPAAYTALGSWLAS